MNRDHEEYLARAEAALRQEIGAQQGKGAAPTPIEDGIRVADEPLGGTYRFTLPYEVILPEGMPLELRVGERRWRAELLYRDGLSILITVERADWGLPDGSVPRAGLVAEPWFLTAELRDRVAELREQARLSIPARTLVGWLCGDQPTGVHERGPQVPGLNHEQSAAVHACSSEPLWFVWGPPGTGKTSTLGSAVRRLVESGESIVIAAHSNVAVDAAMVSAVKALQRSDAGRGLMAAGLVVRAGPPATDEASETGLSGRDLVLSQNPSLERRRRDLEARLRSIAAGRSVGDVQALRVELKELRVAIGEAERALVRNAKVLFCTLSKLVLASEVHERRFDAAIVDEVSMTSPPQVVVAASLAQHRCAVFGDFRQLPPVVISEDPEVRKVLGTDAFSACGVARVAHLDHAPGLTMLREQYRMAPPIRALVSSFAYSGKLRDGDGVAERTAHMAGALPAVDAPVLWRNAARRGARTWSDAGRRSRMNPVSAVCAVRDALELVASDLSVVLLAPYRPQVRLMAALLREAEMGDRVRLGTVHRFQGAEGDAVVLDLVDAPPLPVPGRPLRADPGKRLLTVGISRARGKLVVHGHARLTQEEAHFRDARELLHRVSRTEVPEPESWALRVANLSASTGRGIPPELAALSPGDASAIWLPRQPPPELGALAAGHASDAPDGNAVVIAGSVTWIASQVPGGAWQTLTVTSARFANAFSEVAGGAALTSVRSTADTKGTVVARFDRCATCGDEAALSVGRGYHVSIDCGSCGANRWPTLSELDAWAWAVGYRCPECQGAVRAKRGKSRSFISCATYPKCNGMAYLSELAGRAVVPESQRPARPAAEAPKRKRSVPAPVSRTKSGHKLSDIAEFDDFGIERAEAEQWLDLGLKAEHATDLIGAGFTPESVEAQQNEGVEPLDLWRNARRR